MQGYQGSSGASSKSRSAAINIQNEGIENRYQHQYEQRLDPFRTFSNQEKQRRYAYCVHNILSILILLRINRLDCHIILRYFSISILLLQVWRTKYY